MIEQVKRHEKATRLNNYMWVPPFWDPRIMVIFTMLSVDPRVPVIQKSGPLDDGRLFHQRTAEFNGSNNQIWAPK